MSFFQQLITTCPAFEVSGKLKQSKMGGLSKQKFTHSANAYWVSDVRRHSGCFTESWSTNTLTHKEIISPTTLNFYKQETKVLGMELCLPKVPMLKA